MDDKLNNIQDAGGSAQSTEGLREAFMDLCEYVAELESRVGDIERKFFIPKDEAIDMMRDAIDKALDVIGNGKED